MTKRADIETLRLSGSNNLSRALKYGPETPKSTLVGGRPEPPGDLSAAEKAVFGRTADLLQERGVLTKADGDILAAFARCSVTLAAERALLASEGTVIIQPRKNKHNLEIFLHVRNIRWQIVKDLEARHLSLLKCLGLVPSTRGKVPQAIDAEQALSAAERALAAADKFLSTETN